jgi:large subunit ribosomal protein L6
MPEKVHLAVKLSARSADMSRVASKPIQFPDQLNLDLEGSDIVVTSAKASLALPKTCGVDVKLRDGELQIYYQEASKAAIAGTYRSLLNNFVIGLTVGFKTTLEIKGIGYRATESGGQIKFVLGKSHDDFYTIPSDLTIKVPKPTIVVIEGIDKQRVNQVAAEIQALRPPNAYKARGIYREGKAIKLREVKKK